MLPTGILGSSINPDVCYVTHEHCMHDLCTELLCSSLVRPALQPLELIGLSTNSCLSFTFSWPSSFSIVQTAMTILLNQHAQKTMLVVLDVWQERFPVLLKVDGPHIALTKGGPPCK